MKYITRIEAGSNLAGLGESGSNIGATLSNLVGTPGTLWGETGYNTDTGVSMWPFPNEDLIKTKMAAYTGGEIDGARGFCSDTANPRTDTGEVTLTSYIWEYLGNTDMTASFYDTGDTTSPASVSNLSAATGSSAGEIDLTWTAPGDDNVTGTATSYDIRYSTETITSANWDEAVQLNYHLQAASPCKGTGVDLSASFTTDFAGRPRSVWSMGALE